VEVKAPEIKLTTETIIQAAVYNKSYNCPWLWVTNGRHHIWLLVEENKIKPAEPPANLCSLP
jgi:hypothetical protein